MGYATGSRTAISSLPWCPKWLIHPGNWLPAWTEGCSAPRLCEIGEYCHLNLVVLFQHGLISNVLTLLKHQIFVPSLKESSFLSALSQPQFSLCDVLDVSISSPRCIFLGEMTLRIRSPTPDLRFAHPDLETFQ